MINQQLLYFIKQQLFKGVDKETITKELIGSGWTEQDIKEGFNTVNVPIVSSIINPINNPILTQNTNHSGKKVILIIVALFIIAGGVSGYYFRNYIPVIKDLIKTKTTLPINEIKQEENTQNQVQKEGNATQLQQERSQSVTMNEPTQESELVSKTEDKKVVVVSPKTGLINCGADMSCFMSAIKDCSISSVEETRTVSVFGMFNQTNKQTLKLTGYDTSKKCVFTSHVDDVISLEYSPEFKEMMISKMKEDGRVLSDSEMVEAFKIPDEALASAKSTIGMTTKCSFTTNYLTELLTKWAKGSYSSDDTKLGNCTVTDSFGKVIPTM